MAKELGLVHIWKDDMRKALWPVLSVLPSRTLTTVPRAMSDLVCTVLASVLDAGHGGVVDANFNIPEQAEPIRDLLDERGVPCFEVCLWADPVVLRKRFIERADPPLTPEMEDYFERALHRERRPVLRPPTPIVEFESTEFGALDASHGQLIERISTALGLPNSAGS